MSKLEPTRTYSNTTATEVLRRLLDERGVEYTEDLGYRDFFWNFGEHGKAMASSIGTRGLVQMIVTGITPEQAIAATLGRGTCHNASKVMDEHGQARFACSECHAWIDSRMLWNPECRNGESPWVKDCKLNFCPNCGRKVVTDGQQ